MAAALRELRAARRKRRLADIDWLDSLYRVYVTVGIATFLVWWIAESLGDRRVVGANLVRVRERGPALVGLFVGVAVVSAMRSGLRGGPVAVESPDVLHVLQAPIDRRRALIRPYVHQLRRGAWLGLILGALAGRLVSPFVPGNLTAWLGVGGACGLALGLLWMGTAAVVSGARVGRVTVLAAGVIVLGWSVFDVYAWTRTSPATFVGGLLVRPAGTAVVPVAVGVAALVVPTVVTVALGWVLLGSVSLEKAERRAALIGQLRFAMTTQDLRVVMLLRRQLMAERSRSVPLFRVRGRPGPSAAVIVRCLRSVARWPFPRCVRVVVAAVVAGIAGRAAWEGAVPLVALSGVAAFVAGLEAIEPMAQDADHPNLLASFPRHRGRLANRQVIVPAMLLAALGALAGGVAVAAGPVLGDGFGSIALVGGALALGALGGAAGALGAGVSVAMGPPSLAMSLTSPELALARTLLAPAIPVVAVGGPLLLAFFRAENGSGPGLAEGVLAVAIIGYTGVAWLTNGGIREQKG